VAQNQGGFRLTGSGKASHLRSDGEAPESREPAPGRAGRDSCSTYLECQQQYGPIRFEQIDVDLDNTDRIPSSSVETSTPVVTRIVVWR
jgi:hypothetical protein